MTGPGVESLGVGASASPLVPYSNRPYLQFAHPHSTVTPTTTTHQAEEPVLDGPLLRLFHAGPQVVSLVSSPGHAVAHKATQTARP
jgi:hypothetical protein